MNRINLNDIKAYEKIEKLCLEDEGYNGGLFDTMLQEYDFCTDFVIEKLEEKSVSFSNKKTSGVFLVLVGSWYHLYQEEEYYLPFFFLKDGYYYFSFLNKRLNEFVYCENSGSFLLKESEKVLMEKGADGLVHFYELNCEGEIAKLWGESPFQFEVEYRTDQSSFPYFWVCKASPWNIENNYPDDLSYLKDENVEEDEYQDDEEYSWYEEDERDNTYIKSYHSSHFSPLSCSDEENVPFFGVEIETYQDPENCEWIYEEYGDLFSCEEDASLDKYYGIEMISQPMSWKYWKSIKENISELFSNIYEGDCTLPEGDDESYGSHVHVSRSAFVNQTALHYANILVNAFLKQCEVIARRTDSYSDGEIHHNCDYRHGYYYHYNKLGKLEKITLKDYMLPGTRYASVNNTNADTVEFRIFRTTLDPVVLYGTLEFVKNILEMANSLAMENSGNKYAKFYHIRRVSFNDLLQGDYINAYVEKYKYKEDALTESLLSMTVDLNGYFCPVVCEEKKAKLLSIEVEGEKKSVLEDYDDLKFEHNFKCEDFSIKDYKKVRNLDCFYEKNEKTLVSAEQISRIKRRLQRKTEGSDPMTAAYQKLFGNTALA